MMRQSDRTAKSECVETNEAAIIKELLDEAHALTAVEIRTWSASWLLSPIHGTFWLLRLDGSRLVDGEWKNVLRVDWNDKLPDGSLLSEECNRKYLIFLQQAAFLIREEVRDIRSSISHYIYIMVLKALTEWIFTRSRLYSPAEFGFANVDLAGIHDFMQKYTRGALFEAGDYATRFLREIDKDSLEKFKKLKKPASLYELPQPIVENVMQKLHEMGYYSTTNGVGPSSGLRYINRAKLADLLQTQYHTFKSYRAIAFLRQFEEDYKKKFGNLLVRASDMKTECISHRIKFSDEIDSIPAQQITHAVTTLQSLQELSPILPLSLPPFSTQLAKSPFQRYFDEAGKSEHTPWMPIDVSMAYINESLRWVLIYGTPLVDFYIRANTYFKNNGLLFERSSRYAGEKRSLARDAWTRDNLPQSLRDAGIETWCTKTRKHESKKRCSVTAAMNILFGACMYIISGLLPVRIDELVSLKKTCLVFKKGCGYWIKKRRGKAVENDTHETMDVPVPRTLATAVSVLIRLGAESKNFVSGYDDEDAKYLLHLPYFQSVETLSIGVRDEHTVNYAVDMFCDHVGLPPDKHGRRWYARVHENRKAFLLSFVWYFKFAALDAARWLAGHTDSRHILAYIKNNLDEENVTELEAQFLAEALWNFGVSKHRRGEIRNIGNLYRRVCKHFHVSEISEVREQELSDCLDLLLSQGKVHIDVLNITSASGVRRIALRIRMSNKRDDPA
jgi:hypothetical protein